MGNDIDVCGKEMKYCHSPLSPLESFLGVSLPWCFDKFPNRDNFFKGYLLTVTGDLTLGSEVT